MAARTDKSRVAVAYRLPADLVAQLRETAERLSVPPAKVEVTAIVESALRRELARLERAKAPPGRAGRRGR